MKDDAAKLLLIIMVASLAAGLAVMAGHYLITGQAYTVNYCFDSNKKAGYYPFIPPTRDPAEVL